MATLVAVWTAGCGGGGGGTAAPAAQQGIQLGRSIGDASVGQTFAQVTQLLGQPSNVAAFTQPAATVGIWPSRGLVVHFIDANQDGTANASETCDAIYVYARAGSRSSRSGTLGSIRELLTNDPSFTEYAGRTPEGIGLGSPRATVRQTYGEPLVVYGGTEFYLTRGVGFYYDSIDAQAPVAGIFISDARPSAAAIEKGTLISPLMLDSTYADAKAALGSPSTISPTTGSVNVLWTSKGVSAKFTDTDGNGQVGDDEPCRLVMVTTPYSGKDASGIGLGATRTQVRQVYGSPESTNGSTEIYTSSGISFVYAADGTVMAIGVYPR